MVVRSSSMRVGSRRMRVRVVAFVVKEVSLLVVVVVVSGKRRTCCMRSDNRFMIVWYR